LTDTVCIAKSLKKSAPEGSVTTGIDTARLLNSIVVGHYVKKKKSVENKLKLFLELWSIYLLWLYII